MLDLAQTWLQWSHSLSAAELNSTSVSNSLRATLQWGRSFSAAEIGRARLAVRRWGVLQWSRSLSAAEMPRVFGAGKVVGGTSMGPQLFSCGDPLFGIPDPFGLVASMGPQPFGCGEVAITSRLVLYQNVKELPYPASGRTTQQAELRL